MISIAGIINRDMLRLMWANLIPIDQPKVLLEVVRFLVEQFDVGYVVDVPQKDGRVLCLSRPPSEKSDVLPVDDDEITLSSRPLTRNSSSMSVGSGSSGGHGKGGLVPGKFNRLLVPCIRETRVPALLKDEYERFANIPALVANFRFPVFTPPGLFETLCTRAATRFGMETLFHWKTGYYARKAEEPQCRFYILKIKHDDCSCCFRIELRPEQYSGVQDIEALWGLLLPFVRAFDSMIALFKGNLFLC